MLIHSSSNFSITISVSLPVFIFNFSITFSVSSPVFISIPGAHCELHDDVCDPNPCSPPHVCYQDSQLSYRCECESGLTGPRCDTEIIDMPNCIDDNCPGKNLQWRKTIQKLGHICDGEKPSRIWSVL